MKRKAAIALGSNLGERLTFLFEAAKQISEDVLGDVKGSQVYESKPWGIEEQPLFLNAVIVGLSEWKAPAIIDYLKQLERDMGRMKSEKNGPREIDLDLICLEDDVLDLPGINVPHPRMQDREFVLRPLCDVWAEWTHPILKKAAAELLKTHTEDSTVFFARLL